jgi:threonine dehydrogenase-like Zn-dependent dehydrogenase
MKATLMYGAGDVRVADVPDPVIHAPTDAIVRVVRAAICGSDLHPYRSMPAADQGRPMGHEFLGFGATDIVLASGEEGVEEVRKLTDGHGVDAVLERVGSMQTLTTSFGRPSVPQSPHRPMIPPAGRHT